MTRRSPGPGTSTCLKWRRRRADPHPPEPQRWELRRRQLSGSTFSLWRDSRLGTWPWDGTFHLARWPPVRSRACHKRRSWFQFRRLIWQLNHPIVPAAWDLVCYRRPLDCYLCRVLAVLSHPQSVFSSSRLEHFQPQCAVSWTFHTPAGDGPPCEWTLLEFKKN